MESEKEKDIIQIRWSSNWSTCIFFDAIASSVLRISLIDSLCDTRVSLFGSRIDMWSLDARARF